MQIVELTLVHVRDVDRVIVVRYRSLRDLIEMSNDPAMAKGADFKLASMDHTEVFIVKPTISVVGSVSV